MINIILSGACGKMGFEFIKIVKNSDDAKIVAGIDLVKPKYYDEFDFEITENFHDLKADVVVDFSNPSALNKILNFAEQTKTPIVLATTGYDYEQIEQIKKISKIVPVFFTFNMSIGINLLVSLVKKAYEILGDKFDIEIVEQHHNQKIDAPSGTALMIANALNKKANEKFKFIYDRHNVRQKRHKNEIGIHSIRGGKIVGEHEVMFAGDDEILKISHSANSKTIFAQGALRAAKFIQNKTAKLYDMDDLIKNRI